MHPLFSLLNVVPVFCTLHFHIIPWQLNLFPWFWLPCICWWYQICISSSELWYDLHISRCLVNFSGCVFACEIPLHHEQANIFPFSTESPKFVPLPVFPGSLNVFICLSEKRKRFFSWLLHYLKASLVAQLLKILPAMQETLVRFLGGENPLEEDRANHSGILAWRIPGTEEPGSLQAMRSQSDITWQLTTQSARAATDHTLTGSS